MKRKPGKWVGVYICSTCKEVVSTNQRHDNKGVCPLCGVSAKIDPATVMDFARRARRKVYTGLFAYEWEYKK